VERGAGVEEDGVSRAAVRHGVGTRVLYDGEVVEMHAIGAAERYRGARDGAVSTPIRLIGML
jgi:hypothetical protein